ncbi:restriction endonuclease subunit S, partial [Mycobacterium sp.]|uniref:restriction endonuclease subunit S n=1 Tax=Mycobacterium sp. TaxID=1785 RepID=UPI003BB1902B
RTPGSTRFIGASMKNNGVTDLIDLDPIFETGCVTVPYNGNSVGVAFYQDAPFYASDDVNVLVPPPNGPDVHALLFVCTMIRHERSRYTYGYKWNLRRMKKTTIHLPATTEGDPDWSEMSRFVRGLAFSGAIV